MPSGTLERSFAPLSVPFSFLATVAFLALTTRNIFN